MSVSNNTLTLGIPGYSYQDLYNPEKLQQLHQIFHTELKNQDEKLAEQFEEYANNPDNCSPQSVSDLLVKTAPYVGQFIAKLFDVTEVQLSQSEIITSDVNSVFTFRNKIVNKLSTKFKKVDTSTWNFDVIQTDVDVLQQAAFPETTDIKDEEKAIAYMGARLADLSEHYLLLKKEKPTTYPGGVTEAEEHTRKLRRDLENHAEASVRFETTIQHDDNIAFIDELLNVVERWCHATQLENSPLTNKTLGWLSFKEVAKRDFEHLVHHDSYKRDGFDTWVCDKHNQRRRDGFALTDKRYNERQVLYEVNHCIYCHERDTDSCSKGMRNKKTEDYKTNQLGSVITGCPLEEKISEMHIVKRDGDNIGALALIVLDNPMCPGTGHRICNDCMRGCIYQKTEPVNIPQIETNVLTDVLFMPWGFEIYSFLTRWNPLNINRPFALPYNGKNIMVVGMGPAGYTLAHYLLNEGFSVVGIDALKIEPLPLHLVGDQNTPPEPIRDFNDIYEELDKRLLAGFGGVAEYGITVRWDKNFLKVIYLTLARHNAFRCYGGIRFGGTITIEDAWNMGFDHIAIASGAGKPTIIGLKNNLIRGIRKASDFLMSLQLTGAAKENSMANLQIRLPAGVIGGGLTAIDTTTEVMAYYPVQVEKTLKRYTILCDELGEQAVRDLYDEEELSILDEFLEHGKAIVAERQRASSVNEPPNFEPLINSWGGVTMFYRKGIRNSPAYTQNHEEIHEALQEGIQLAEGMNPLEAIPDRYEALQAVKFDKLIEKEGQWISESNELEVPLKSLFIAAGTAPNTIYEQEFPYSFRMDKKFFQRYEPHWEGNDLPELVPMDDEMEPKIGKPAPFTSYQKNGKYISFYGDNHPVYAGNVVKAMASAKDGYPYVVSLFEKELKQLDITKQLERERQLNQLFDQLDQQLLATVVEVNRLTPNIVEVIVNAPMQAKKFHPGQFYRVQNFESLAPTVNDTVLAAEGLALTGAWVDKDQGLISLITLEMGSSSRLCATWKPGDPLVVMGVTGAPTEISENKTVMLVGGGLGNAVQFSIGKALRALGNKVIYFAGYKNPTDVFKVEDIEAASDVIVWAVDPAPGVESIQTTRPQDKSTVGNILEAIERFAKGELGESDISLSDVDNMIVIGSDRMMAAVKEARHGSLKEYFKQDHTAIGSINSPMQCMMKGVCAQCLCKHIDPNTKEEYFVYSCYNQDQDLDRVDFDNLNARLRQNSVQEKLSNLWLDKIFKEYQP